MRRYCSVHIYVLLIAVLMLSPVLGVLADGHLPSTPVADASRDAEQDINKFIWFSAGMLPVCLVSGVVLASTSQSTSSDYDEVSFLYSLPMYSALIGLITGAVFPVSPPAERFMGKSAEYVSAYTKAYQLKTRWARVKAAGTGSATGCCIGIAGIVFIWLNSDSYFGGAF